MTIKLGLFDDHEIVRQGFKYILAEQADMMIQAEGGTGREALEAIRTCALDICIVDLAMPDLSGLDVLKKSKAICPSTAILILSGFSEEQYGLNILKAGAHGFLSKTLAPQQLVHAVQVVAAGERYISAKLSEMLVTNLTKNIDQPVHLRLSEREFQIFNKIVVGKSITCIAAELNLSTKTISTYRARLLDKMGVRSNAELTQYAMCHGLLKMIKNSTNSD